MWASSHITIPPEHFLLIKHTNLVKPQATMNKISFEEITIAGKHGYISSQLFENGKFLSVISKRLQSTKRFLLDCYELANLKQPLHVESILGTHRKKQNPTNMIIFISNVKILKYSTNLETIPNSDFPYAFNVTHSKIEFRENR